MGAAMPMDPDLKRRWVEALRSGEYEQTTAALVRLPLEGANSHPEKDSFCCLGVLCEVAGLERSDSGRSFRLPEEARMGGMSELIDSTLGAWRQIVGIDETHQNDLMELNDVGRRSFAQIADYVERNL